MYICTSVPDSARVVPRPLLQQQHALTGNTPHPPTPLPVSMRGMALRACARARRCAPPARRGFSSSVAARAVAAAAEEDTGARTANRAAAAAAAGVLLAAAYALRPVAPPPSDPHLTGTDTTISNWCARARCKQPSACVTHTTLTLRRAPRARAAAPRRSNTHEVSTSHYFQPESLAELESLVAHAHARRMKLRPVGSGLSPNGLGFAPGGMVNLALCDKARATPRHPRRGVSRAGLGCTRHTRATLRQHHPPAT